MHKIGILIYSHNKKEGLVSCINSVLASDTDDYDIYIIDDASTDNSLGMVTTIFDDKIHLLKNNEYLGNCKSLCIGVQHIMNLGYEYICCLGNDVTISEKSLSTMLNYLKANPDVGMVGGKVFHMHMPNYIQQYGITLDFKHFRVQTLYSDVINNDEIPSIVYCDTLNSCGIMLPADVIRKTGLPPEDTFLYWDDMEWGYQIKLAGYKVVALGDAAIYHSSNPQLWRETTLANYYMTRNCLHFFMKYTKPENCAQMSIVLLRAVYEDFYLHKMSQAHNMAQTSIAALLDALNGLRGKAPANRIQENDENGLGFVSFFSECEKVYLDDDDPFLEEIIRQINPDITFIHEEADDAVVVSRCDSILKLA